MIFLDTGFLFALFVAGDVHHERVVQVFKDFRGQSLRTVLLTTSYVVTETITLLLKRGHPDPAVRHDLAVRAGQQLLEGSFGTVHRPTPEEDRAALAFLAQHGDQQYSFADCVSFVIMERLGIEEALAVDSDFTHRFVARPGPLRPRS